MKIKILMYLMFFFVLISNSFSFDVLNSKGESQQYFSLNDNQIKVVSKVQVSNLSVNYLISNEVKSQVFLFQNCTQGYCATFSLSSLIESSNGGFSGSREFNISVLDTMKQVFIDIEKPKMNLNSIVLNSSSKQVEFKFNFSDNSNKIKNAKLYLKESNSEIFIADVLNLNNYNYKIEKEGDYVFLFKVEDEAGNLEIFEYDFYVEDIFEPTIEYVYVVLRDSKYELEFKIEDDINLSKYELIQGNLIVTEDVTGFSFNKIISIPFSSGNIIFKVYDKQGNIFEKTISLNSVISNTFNDKYSNTKSFNFKSNADKCVLTNIDSKSYNLDFSKISDVFKIDLDINKVQEYKISFYCTKDNFKEYYQKEFYYDINKPSEFELKIVANDEGYVSLSWSESFDKESEVSYKIYRNDKVVYQSSKLDFEDKKALYPSTYIYYVEAYDLASNSVKTSKIEVKPKKVKVDLITNIVSGRVLTNSDFNFDITTDKNSKVSVIVKSAGAVIDSKLYENTEIEKLNFNFKLNPGINQVLVEIVDEVQNKFEETYFITYDGSLIKPSIQEVEEEIIIEPVYEEPQRVIEEKEIVQEVQEENSFSWIWFILFLIIFAIFIKIFIIDEDKLTFLKKPLKAKSKNKNKKLPLLSVERAKDYNLEKDFERIKKERIKKQYEAKRNAEKLKDMETRGRTDLERKKLDDLSNRKNFTIPIKKGEVSKKVNKNIVREKTYEEDLVPTKNNLISDENKRSFFGSSKPQKPQDDFSVYLQKIKSKPSWNSTSDYVNKPEEVSQTSQNDLDKNQIKENLNVASDNNKNNESSINNSNNLVGSKKHTKISLDDYLNKAIKKRSKNNFYFAEKSVERDLNRRD